jgi:hypothetical protein
VDVKNKLSGESKNRENVEFFNAFGILDIGRSHVMRYPLPVSSSFSF